MKTLQTSPVTAEQIKTWIDQDPVLSRVRNLVQKRWGEMSDDALEPYARRKNELSVQDGCVLCGCRVIIPVIGREQVMDEIHNGHPGVSRMKSIARGVSVVAQN